MTVNEILAYLKKHGSSSNVSGMARFGITPAKAFGVHTPTVRKLAKEIGTDHSLALSLWKTKYHEARILATLIADPEKVTEELMEIWVNDFDSWAVCDACCGELFVYTPFAIQKTDEWCHREKEFVKRAGFVMIAELAVHRKDIANEIFLRFFPVIECEATDERNFVRKAVNWALRQIGKRNASLNRKAIALSRKLSKMNNSTARWIGNDAIKDLHSPIVIRRLSKLKFRTKRRSTKN